MTQTSETTVPQTPARRLRVPLQHDRHGRHHHGGGRAHPHRLG